MGAGEGLRRSCLRRARALQLSRGTGSGEKQRGAVISQPGAPLHRLDATPVCGVSLANVAVLRLDLAGGAAPGNKSFKLLPWIERARREGIGRLVSFGGAWSNHLHALAAVGAEQGLDTVALVRADEGEPDTPMLADARVWGMQIHRIGRGEYRRRNDADYLEAVRERFKPCLVIPEGGAGVESAGACRAIADMIVQRAPLARTVVLPVGTGTTLAGVIAGLNERYTVIGVSALKGADDLEGRVQCLLEQLPGGERAGWRILHNFHCGGFARSSSALRGFVQAFEAQHEIALDPVYTAKAMYAVQQLLADGTLGAGSEVMLVHTGGLQGRRGCQWLRPMLNPSRSDTSPLRTRRAVDR